MCILIIPEQFTVKAQQPLLGVKKRRGRRRRSKNIFSSGNLMSCPELYSQVKSDNKFFFLGRTFWTSLFSSRNLCSKVKSDKQKPPHKGDGGWWEERGVVG